MTRAYSVCLFTAWEDRPCADVWVKRTVVDGAADIDAEPLLGVPATFRDRHPLPEVLCRCLHRAALRGTVAPAAAPLPA